MTRPTIRLLAATTLFALSATPALAQGPADDDAGAIIVTARRTEERLQDVPISITVFNQQQLNDRNITNAGDLGKFTPSLTTNSRFGSENSFFSLRGFTQEIQNSPTVGVYFGEVVAARAAGGTTGGNGAGPGSFFDLQNVQVLKGPQGTLFGRNTTGGAVLLVPQKPTDNLEGYVEGSIGNYGLLRGQAVLNIPLADTFKVRLGVDRQKRDGYLKNVSGIGVKDYNDIDYFAARLSILAELTPDLENYVIASYMRSDTNGSFSKIVSQDNASRDPCTSAAVRAAFPTVCPVDLRAAQIAATSGNFWNVSGGRPDARQLIEQWQVINTTTWTASDTLTIKNIVSYAEYRQRSRGDIFGENGFQSGATVGYHPAGANNVPGTNNIGQSTFTEELQLQGKPSDNLSYQVGGYLEVADPLQGFQTTIGASGIACSDIVAKLCADITGRGFEQLSQSKYHFRNLGLYAQGTLKFAPTLSLTAGFRYTSDVQSGLGQVLKYTFPAGSTPSAPSGVACSQPTGVVIGGTSAQIAADPSRCNFSRRVSSNRPTWLVDLDWKPNDDVLVYAKYARGYRQGGVNVTSYGLETWGPEKLDLYEIGAKTSFDGAVRGTFNIAAFYNDFASQQIAINTLPCSLLPPAQQPASCVGAPAVSAAQGIASGATSTIKGVEVDASISPFAGFRVDVGYAYLDTKLKSFPDLSNVPPGFAQLLPAATVGGVLAMTPKNKVTVTGSYTVPLPETLGRMTLSATYTYQSSMFGNSSSLPSRQTIAPQNLVNANLNWSSVAGSPVDLSFFITNLTNEKYYTYYIGSSFGWEAGIPNEPRMYGVRVKYRFGD
ncbi:TonB-dependent receptor [Novosphingobium sp. JCM 18896]|uniref:TonB-dependent receptor n=1 Tax=Novosphingobium sp. JCM 18896 TaxID=2989731 RepID=UPI0022223336|nr:TonB-dependent receptor [Novosphingobium sp. JCM 18896]MCW1431691.1 TonB-dependent receptor [Novosphingobium sp. JCM 18896]